MPDWDDGFESHSWSNYALVVQLDRMRVYETCDSGSNPGESTKRVKEMRNVRDVVSEPSSPKDGAYNNIRWFSTLYWLMVKWFIISDFESEVLGSNPSGSALGKAAICRCGSVMSVALEIGATLQIMGPWCNWSNTPDCLSGCWGFESLRSRWFFWVWLSLNLL